MNARSAHLPERVRCLVEAVHAESQLTPSSTRKLLAQSGITTADLEPWADYGHPKADSYGRKLAYSGGFFELMVMSWVDGDMATIHDHGYTQWGAVLLLGDVEHSIFRVDDGVLTTAERRMHAPGSVLAVGHDLIHQMGNVRQAPYLTMHLYGCYERDCDVTADARLYELDEKRVQVTSGGVFFSLPESAIGRREDCPPADFPTTLRFKVELLRRLLTMNDSRRHGSFQSEREARVAGELFAAETWEQARQELDRKTAGEQARLDHYHQILSQELSATARLQLELIDAGLLATPLDSRRDALAELIAMDDREERAARYLELLGDTYSIEFPLATAA